MDAEGSEYRYFYVDPEEDMVWQSSQALEQDLFNRRRRVPEWAGKIVKALQVLLRHNNDSVEILSMRPIYTPFDKDGFVNRVELSKQIAAKMRQASFADWELDDATTHLLQAYLVKGVKSPRIKTRLPWEWVR
ncbi:hypothetical protein [Inquilinus sp. OTU3971]|uniref:hypothetical protein n=1 Tax=Inquilinus sp. OTU3971 TaxID=3043855 RepID=UPI00313ECC9B